MRKILSALQVSLDGFNEGLNGELARKVPSKGEIDYARFAEKTPHVVKARIAENASRRLGGKP